MTRKINFNAGPSTLPLPVLEQIQGEFVDYQGIGLSLIEASHRSKDYDEVHNDTIALFKEILNISDNYKVLFMGGGATLQFSMIPLNFLTEGKSCDFTLTGSWAKKAYGDAKKVGKVNVVFDGSDNNYMKLPNAGEMNLDSNAAYVHVTSNETIGGVQWNDFPETGNVPLIADMSSDIMSRSIDINKFGMIYAGAQKNLGPSGLAVVIIRDDLIGKSNENLTAYLNYQTHADANSLYNTPPVFPIYVFNRVLKWVKDCGGLSGIEEKNNRKAAMIYDAINECGDFYNCPVEEKSRSKMNVVFTLPSDELTKKFIEEATANDMIGLKGHRSVGGCRASIYNAMPEEGCEKLAALMKEFHKKNS